MIMQFIIITPHNYCIGLLGYYVGLRQMRSTVTDRVAWTVGRSVTAVSPAKWLIYRSRCPLGSGLGWARQRDHVLDGSTSPMGRAILRGKGRAANCKV